MGKKLWCALIIAGLGIGAVLYRMEAGFGCGPFPVVAYFTYTLHPDLPVDSYARGNLGVVQPTYARSYLYVAYRYMSGKSFSSDEQKELVELWNERLGIFEPNTSQNGVAGRSLPWLEQWIEARNKVIGGPRPSIQVYRARGKSYEYYFNCMDDGFRTAIATLDQRVTKFGADSPLVKEWLSAQDEVFANCAGRSAVLGNNAPPAAVIPVSLESGAPQQARWDREYQIAAAYFYSADFDEAARQFQAIANEPDSPWQHISRLLVARCLIRKATLNADDNTTDSATLAHAQELLNQIINDPDMSELHASAQRLEDFVEIRLRPRMTERLLAANLLQEHVGDHLKQNLLDYTILINQSSQPDEKENTNTTALIPESNTPESAGLRTGDDLTDWIGTFQEGTETSLKHSLEKWTETRSLAWLAASLSKVHAGQPGVPQLLKGAEAVPPDSPAFATVEFHRLRLLSEAHRNNEVRLGVDKLLSRQRESMPPSTLNLFLALRMKVAEDLEEFLKFAQRFPASDAVAEDNTELPTDFRNSPGDQPPKSKQEILLDADSTEILSKMLPLDFLAQAAESKTLSHDLRRQVAQAVWVRAILLDEPAVARRITPVWENLDPAVKAALESYLAEKSPDGARFAAVFLMLKFPGTRPIIDSGAGREIAFGVVDHLRDNWWCLPPAAPPGERNNSPGEPGPLNGPLRLIYPGQEPSPPAFISPEQKIEGEGEWNKLTRVAPNYFAKEVLAWGKQHPDDPREAEALYLVVSATHYGCTDGATAGLSKAAFLFLHSHYPKTEWARKTKYWYGTGM